jgi:hypothetical protein
MRYSEVGQTSLAIHHSQSSCHSIMQNHWRRLLVAESQVSSGVTEVEGATTDSLNRLKIMRADLCKADVFRDAISYTYSPLHSPMNQ